MSHPTPEQVREALGILRREHKPPRFESWDCAHEWACVALESALAPPPVEDAALRPDGVAPCTTCNHYRMLAESAQVKGQENAAALASLRSQVAAKDDEVASRKYQMELRNDAWVAECDRVRAAAENRGFREAAEWASNRYGKPDPNEGLYAAGKREGISEVICNIRAEADRRDGPPGSVWPLGDGSDDRLEGK